MSEMKAILQSLSKFVPDDKKPILDRQTERTMQLVSGDSSFKPTLWKGYRFLPGFESDTAKYCYEKKEYDKNSILIATFPKTGSTWGSQLIGDIVFGHDRKSLDIWKLMTPSIKFLEINTAEKFEATDLLPLPKKVYGSHLPEELVNVEKIIKSGGKIICISRNPKDQAVSLYHFAQSPLFESVRDEIPSTWPEFFDKYVTGQLPLITRPGEWYPDYLLGWHKHRNNPNFLFVRYEDLKKDTTEEVSRIAKFLEVNLSKERIAEIVEKNSFKETKESSQKETGTVRSVLNKIGFFRKGEVGSWKNVFTVAQSELMDAIIEEKLGKTDIKLTYEI